MTKPKSEQAQVAALMKKYCKGLGVQCSATSESFSMGDSVRVRIQDVPKDLFEQIETHAAQYQYGHFDGMTDYYDMSNVNREIPQTKFLFVDNNYSSELRQKAWDYLRGQWTEAAEGPADYKEATNHRIGGSYASDYVYRTLRNDGDFWKTQAKPKAAAKTGSGSAFSISEHTHTKRGFQMFIVQMTSHVEREEFVSLREAAQSMGGWYSRKWGQTPCGFAFKEYETASAFAAQYLTTDTPPDAPKPTKATKNYAEKLRTMADKMQPTIDNKFADRQTNTPKRLAQDRHSRLEGERLQRTQSALYALADLHTSGNVPPVLASIHTKAVIYDLMATKLDSVDNGFHGYSICTGEPRHTTPEAVALWSLIDGKSEEDKKSEELRRKIDELQFSTIPGYFPTPQPVIDLMLEHADIQLTDIVLEPSLGSCAIADAVAPLCAEVNGFEINFTLSEICEAKGYLNKRCDFLTVDLGPADSGTSYDKVLMNPPFENLQDIHHVMHAFRFLKDGGRLVAIMSPGPFFRTDKKSRAFRAWFERFGGEVYDLPENSFKASGTGVASKLVVIDKES